MLEQKHIHRLKNLLLSQQQELMALEQTASAAAAVVELDQSRVGRLSRMDALQEQAMSQERERRCKKQLLKIEAALKRVEHDEYGYCEECGDEIAFRRLEFDPATSLCFNCANSKP